MTFFRSAAGIKQSAAAELKTARKDHRWGTKMHKDGRKREEKVVWVYKMFDIWICLFHPFIF